MNKDIQFIQYSILKWHQQHARDFPWRHTKDPYKIMIAEFMLHRTKAEQAVPVYSKFIKQYPDVFSLASANPAEIKKVTEHLGLHWRSKHFIKSARFILEKYNEKFPDEYEQLRKIPGVGEYIAGAILTVCFNKPAPAVDSNIARFINRFYGLDLAGEIRRKKEVVRHSEELFNHGNPGQILFAMVDFTSLICKPQTPDCDSCPLKLHCRFHRSSSSNRGLSGSM